LKIYTPYREAKATLLKRRPTGELEAALAGAKDFHQFSSELGHSEGLVNRAFPTLRQRLPNRGLPRRSNSQSLYAIQLHHWPVSDWAVLAKSFVAKPQARTPKTDAMPAMARSLPVSLFIRPSNEFCKSRCCVILAVGPSTPLGACLDLIAREQPRPSPQAVSVSNRA